MRATTGSCWSSPAPARPAGRSTTSTRRCSTAAATWWTLGGDAFLDVYASGTTWPAAGYYSGPQQFEPENGRHVDDVYVAGTFEGYTQVLAGIEGDRVPFRVFTLSDPSRLVVDVAD